MNISSPVASEIASVNFTFLSTEDIQNVSVKQIINPMTFENTIPGKIPVPMAGGLYDPALGASDGLRQRCATCFLDYKYCPGHLGHIALPVPVYHSLFFDQMLRLLRSTCVFCFHFRISQLEVNRVVCKLQLIQYGLLVEAQELDDMFTTKATSKKKRVKSRNGSEEEGPGDEIETEDEDDMDEFMERRRAFVDRAIRKNKKRVGDWSQGKILSVAEERRELIKTFMGDLIRPKKCNRCKGASPEFRVDNYSKIFEKPLPKKAKDSNYLLGLRRRNTALDRKKSPEGIQQGKKYSSDAMDIDEGISVEIEEESEDEDEDEGQTKTTETEKGAAGRLITSIETLNTLTRLFENEKDIAQLLYQPRFAGSKNSKPVSPQMFFLHSIAVPPTKFRPPQVAGGEVTEASSNKPLVKILQDCLYIRDRKELYSRPGETHESKQNMMRVLIGAFVSLQESVNTFLDSTKSPITGNAAKSIEEGIKQKLEKKEGLFRKNMMGKRVNFAARSVISPDPNIETREIGVPPVFACKLTYPEPVTEINHQHMMELVINGPDKWPGAVAIENENGSVQKLPTDKESSGKAKRQQLAQTLLTPDPLSLSDSRPKKVHRHLRDGDVVLMNRQPTLHKPSIMGHIAKVLPKERTIRMHYANCNTYNADFDGDEMNMHLPQNEVARAEAQEIANTDSQYLVATSGKPLRGLIQDHLVMGVWLTNRDTMFTRDEYQQLVYSCLLPEQNSIFFGKSSNRIETIPPAIIKPRPLWTGKQIITTILENIRPKYFAGLTLNSTSKTPGDSWDKGSEEGKVIFHDGYFACGILDKNQLGPTEFGFVHSIYEIYGGSVAGSLLTILGRLLTKFLHMRAHTCGMDDLLLTPQGDARRRKELSGSKEVGRSLSAEYVSLKKDDYQEAELNLRMEEVLRDEEKHRTLDLKANAQTKDFTSAVISECLPSGLQKHFPHNNFQAMTVSGAKGSNVNATQISCLLGQQVLEGRRVPVMVSGKTLPCFKPFETDVRAGGYVTDRFLTGIRPQEYFFHCMAGREGLIDTAVKTSRSGYLQRCLIKGMEGIQVAYDNTVRDSDGSLVQFLYGEDGLDVVKQKHLHQFKFLAQNMKSILRKLSDDLISEDLGDRLSELSEKLNVDVAAHERVKKAMKKYHKKRDLGASEVTMSELNPSRYVGSVSEKFAQAREKYIKDNPDNLIVSAKVSQKDRKMVGQELSQGLGKTEFRNLMDLKYLRSIIDPGEAVGIIAGQSIGEPSTQMTLNTFHLAGHATKNVTLGIPRLREIVMTASANIRTPTMTLTLNPDVSDEEAEIFTKRCSKLTLSEVIDGVTITEVLTRSSKTYKIRLDLFSRDDYSQEYSLTQSRVHNVLRNKFLSLLEGTIIKALNAKGRKSKESIGKDDAMPDVGESAGRIEEATKANTGEEAGDDSDDDDGDATSAKQARNKTEAVSYEAPDEDEEEIHRKGLIEESATENEDEDEGLGASTKGGDTENSGESDKEPKKAEGSKKKNTVETTKLGSSNVVRFEFDENDGQWCEIDLEYPSEAPKVLMLGIVERVCRDTIIHQLPSIGAIVKVPHSELEPEDQKAGKKKLAVEGVNFHAFWDEQDTVDPDTMETNDIAAFLKYYGVEAARNNVVKEMNSVFKGHGISVDLRHLNLIADIMTRGGGYTPFNRQGLRTSVSPFLKMSFETTCNFLRDAVLEGDFDDMTSPSSRIVMGKLSGVGSGSFDVMVGGLRAESYV